MKLTLLFCWIPFQAHSQVQGKVELDRNMFNAEKPSESVKIRASVSYKGNQSIQEVPYLDIKTDSTGITHTNVDVKYYLFIDPDLHEYFYYRNFSDTSKVVMHCKGGNPFEKYGGWDLYSDKKFDYDESQKLANTVISSNDYSRYRFRKIKNGKADDFILYTLCGKKEIPIIYLKPFSKEIGCPVVRLDTYYEGRLVSITQLQYISDTLTSKEKRVFQAWQKNLELY